MSFVVQCSSRAGTEFCGIRPAMFLRRIRRTSQTFARHSRQNVAISVFPSAAARGLLFLVLIPTLRVTGATAARSKHPATPRSPARFDDLAARAAAARDQQNLPLAIQLYTQAEQIKPDWQEGWWYLGMLQYSSNQFPGAIDAFNHLLQLVPTAVPAMALRGLCEFETGAYDDSLRDLEQAVAHGALNQPHNEEIIRYHLAQLLAHASRFQEALDQYRFFAEHHADAPDLMIGIGLAGMRVPPFQRMFQHRTAIYIKQPAMQDTSFSREITSRRMTFSRSFSSATLPHRIFATFTVSSCFRMIPVSP